MALYDISSGTQAVASDVEQLVNIWTGKHDIGNVNFAPQLSAPSSSNFTLATQAGSSLGIGAYNYQFTYVTGQFKSDGVTTVITGETLPSAAKSVTTTSGNTNVLITLPTSSLPISLIAFNIYRTSVGGSDYKLIATVKAGSATYQDSTSDASRGSQTLPSSNTTGTILNQYIRANYKLEICLITLFTNGGSNTSQGNATFVNSYSSIPYIGPMYLTNTNGVNNSDDIVYPYFFNLSTTGFSAKIKAEGSGLLGTATPTNIFLNCIVIGN